MTHHDIKPADANFSFFLGKKMNSYITGLIDNVHKVFHILQSTIYLIRSCYVLPNTE